MDKTKVLDGVYLFRELANKPVFGETNHVSSRLCKYMKDHHFRALFGISWHTVFLLQTVMNVPKDGPSGGNLNSCGADVNVLERLLQW